MRALRQADLDGTAEDLRTRLAADGYLFVRGLIPADAVQRVRDDVVTVLERASWTVADPDPEAPLPGPQACLEGGATYFDAYRGMLALQSLNELAHHPAVTAFVSRVVGDPLLVHPRKIGRMSLPRAREYTRAHQDFRLVQGTPDTLTMWLPLNDCPRPLGGLRVLEGSHRRGLRSVEPAPGPGGLATSGVVDVDADWCTADYARGDAIIFHSLTVHGALPNETDHLRLSVDFRYQSVLEPVATPSLLPHYFGHAAAAMPTWPVLARGWTSMASISTPDDIVEVRMGDPWDDDLALPEPTLVTVG